VKEGVGCRAVAGHRRGVGSLIVAASGRFARSPCSTWIRTTVVLTALSLVPDGIADADIAKARLMLTRLVAAVIVVLAVARRLRA